jgi:hypothetical protein
MAREVIRLAATSSSVKVQLNCSDQLLISFYMLSLLASLRRDCCRFVKLLLLLLPLASGAGPGVVGAAAAAACCSLLRVPVLGQHMYGSVYNRGTAWHAAEPTHQAVVGQGSTRVN